MSDLHRLHALADSLRRGIQQKHRVSILERASRVTIEAIKAETPYKTGELYRGNTYHVSSMGDYARITNIKDYARIINDGRKEVVAKAGKALRFEINGVVFFRKRVKGVKPNPFYRRGTDRAAPARARMAKEVGGQILADVTGRPL